MPSGRALQTSLNAGEISPRARGRSDLEAYFQGAALLDNVFPLLEGPATRRPGFEFVALSRNQNARGRLIGFTRSLETTVMIEATPLLLRYIDGETLQPLMDGASPVETVTSFDQSDVDGLYTAQSADVMWFCVRDSRQPPYALKRFSDDNWRYDPYDILKGPYLADDFRGISITANQLEVGQNARLDASAPIFDADQSGGLYRLYSDARGVPVKQWKADEGKADDDPNLSAGQQREHNGRVYEVVGSGIGSNQPPVHDVGVVADGGGQISWRYLHDLAGSVRITSVSSSTRAFGDIEERLAETTTAYWAQGAFSDEAGWPKIVGVFEERLFFASTRLEPDTVFFSRTAGYNELDADFQPTAGNGEVLDDHAIKRAIAGNVINPPAWAEEFDGLILGTPRGLIRITGPSADEPLTPAGALARGVKGSKPASRICRGVIADGALVYASLSGTKIYENDEEGRHRTLTARAEHVGGRAVVKTVWCGEPFNRLFALREDGKLFALVYEREENVLGWCRVTPAPSSGGAAVFEDIEKLQDAAGAERLWALVRRPVAGGTQRSIERLALDWRAESRLPDQAVYMDAAVTADRWNADPGRTMQLTALTDDPGPGDPATLRSVGQALGAGDVGRILALRVATPPKAPGGRWRVALCQVEIKSVSFSSQAEVEFVIGPDEGDALLDVRISDWAWTSQEIGGLGHLEGETVLVQADGMEYGEATVAGGRVVLDTPFARATAGLAVPWRARSLPMAQQLPGGTSRGKVISIQNAFVTMQETGPEQASIRVLEDVEDDGNMEDIEDGEPGEAVVIGGRDEADLLGAPPRIGRFHQEIDMPSGGGKDVQIELFGAGALPATLESIAMEYDVET